MFIKFRRKRILMHRSDFNFAGITRAIFTSREGWISREQRISGAFWHIYLATNQRHTDRVALCLHQLCTPVTRPTDIIVDRWRHASIIAANFGCLINPGRLSTSRGQRDYIDLLIARSNALPSFFCLRSIMDTPRRIPTIAKKQQTNGGVDISVQTLRKLRRNNNSRFHENANTKRDL